MQLRQALSILSKASPFAVKTLAHENQKSDFDVYKNYLYIETDIEKDVERALASANNKDIIFLCGSSGDGKSEILVRFFEKFNSRIIFHLDATHSFKPQQTAIEALDDVFSEFKEGDKPLVVGINIGMIGNYAEEGKAIHDDIKESINSFLSGKPITPHHKYFHFEDYPKFIFEDGKSTAKFAKQLLKLITANHSKNPFYNLYLQEKEKGEDSKIIANYFLLGLDGVQDVIVDEIFKARLIKDQFLTARSLLDFVYHMLTGDKYLFDNLFDGGDSDLAHKISDFDPSCIRNKNIDYFVLQYGINIIDDDVKEFISSSREIGIKDTLDAKSLIRFFYLLRKSDFGNHFYDKFHKDFGKNSIKKYAEIWRLHKDYEKCLKKKTKTFYNDVIVNAIRLYINRNAPPLKKGEYFVGCYNGYTIAVRLEVKVDLKLIEQDNNTNINYFHAYLKAGDKPLPTIEISFNLFNLIQKINAGYRPNRHDKNVVIKLEDIASHLLIIAKQSNDLKIIKGSNRWAIKNLIDDEEFEVREV